MHLRRFAAYYRDVVVFEALRFRLWVHVLLGVNWGKMKKERLWHRFELRGIFRLVSAYLKSIGACKG